MAQTVILHGDSQRRFAHELIEKAPKGAVLSIKEAKRSLPQNDFMWQLLSDISRSKPDGRHHTPEVWKNLMLHACGHAVQFEMGLNGQPFPVGFSSSKLSKSQMADLLTFIIQWGDEKGVRWTTPKESMDDISSGDVGNGNRCG